MFKKNKDEIIEKIEYNLYNKMVLDRHDITEHDVYLATVDVVKEIISYPWRDTKDRFFSKKKIYYLSFEYLPERFLNRNLLMLGLKEEFKEALLELGYDLDSILDNETLGKLGGGALGRFAFSFLDSASSKDTNLMGYGIRYKNGRLKQEIVDCNQVEKTDSWLKLGFPWEYRKNIIYDVEFKDFTVQGQAYDMPIIGYGGKTVNTLRLWSVLDNTFIHPDTVLKENIEDIYSKYIKIKSITGFLYPEDSNIDGRKIRCRQEYFYSTCSIKDILNNLIKEDLDLGKIDEYIDIKLNENHTLMSIPVFIKEYSKITGLDYNIALEKAKRIFNYTAFENFVANHKIWTKDIIEEICPSIIDCIEFINKSIYELLNYKSVGVNGVNYQKMMVIDGNNIDFTNIALFVSNSINAISDMHYKIMTDGDLNSYSNLYPRKYNTNRAGVSQRTWLYIANNKLSNYLRDILSKDIIKEPKYLIELEKYGRDKEILENIESIKYENKVKVEKYIYEKYNISINPNSIFDMQLKNFVEYRRQILTALYITKIYFDLLENSNLDIVERTYFFGGIASPTYLAAKYIINYINNLASIINSDLRIKDKIKVVFIDDLNMGETIRLIPSADINEQISTPGLDIAGVSAVKYMLNGGLTIGSRTGINLEIRNEIGERNIFLFGKSQGDLEAQFKHNYYNPNEYVEKNRDLNKLINNIRNSNNIKLKDSFENLYRIIMKYNDSFMVFRDFSSYIRVQKQVDERYRIRDEWNSMQIFNIANSGKFSVDHSVNNFKNIIDKEK